MDEDHNAEPGRTSPHVGEIARPLDSLAAEAAQSESGPGQTPIIADTGINDGPVNDDGPEGNNRSTEIKTEIKEEHDGGESPTQQPQSGEEDHIADEQTFRGERTALRTSTMPNKKPEPKRPGKESGRNWICYWEGCNNIYTRRRTVADHMVKAHRIKKEDFDTERCHEIKFLDEAKTKWEVLDHSQRRRPPKKVPSRPMQPVLGSVAASSLPRQLDRMPTHSPAADSVAKRKASVVGTPTKSSNVSRAGSPTREPTTAGSREQTDDEDYSGEDDYDEDDGEVYCLCRRPDDGTPMVCCDGCDEWYHIKCVGLHKEEVNNLLVKYYCPKCIEQRKGESVFRIECTMNWCRKAALPELKYQFCGPQHQEDWILYHIKRSDPSFQIKNREANALFMAWVGRMKRKYGDDWEPEPKSKALQDTMGKLSITSTEKPTLAGPLKAGELKALIDSVQTIEDFRKLGSNGYAPIKPEPHVDIKSRTYPTHDIDGNATPEHQFAVLKELLDLRREVFNAAKASHKPRVYCGYDDRLANQYVAFRKVMEAGAPLYKPCEQKNCRQHNDWMKNEARSLGLEAEILRDLAKDLGIRFV